MYTNLPMYLAAKLMFLGMPLILTLTIPASLLAAVMIVFGRMSSDRELLALKASGIGLAPIVAPVMLLAVGLMVFDYWLVAYVVPRCQKEFNDMKHEIVTSNPMALLSPEEIVDKIPGWRIYFSSLTGNQLNDVCLWRLEDGTNRVTSSIRADRATIDLDLDHQQLVMKLINGREEEYPHDGDVMKVHPGAHGEQMVEAVSLNSFYEKVQKKLAWMTLPDIWDIISGNAAGAHRGIGYALPHRIPGAHLFFDHGVHLCHYRAASGDPDPATRNVLRHRHRAGDCVPLFSFGTGRKRNEDSGFLLSRSHHLDPEHHFPGRRFLSFLPREPEVMIEREWIAHSHRSGPRSVKAITQGAIQHSLGINF